MKEEEDKGEDPEKEAARLAMVEALRREVAGLHRDNSNLAANNSRLLDEVEALRTQVEHLEADVESLTPRPGRVPPAIESPRGFFLYVLGVKFSKP